MQRGRARPWAGVREGERGGGREGGRAGRERESGQRAGREREVLDGFVPELGHDGGAVQQPVRGGRRRGGGRPGGGGCGGFAGRDGGGRGVGRLGQRARVREKHVGEEEDQGQDGGDRGGSAAGHCGGAGGAGRERAGRRGLLWAGRDYCGRRAEQS